MSLLWRHRLIGLALALVIYLADQYLKGLMLGPLDLRAQPGGQIVLLPFFNLTWTQNFGISLGMFQATSQEMRWLLVALTALIALVVFIWMLREKALGDIVGLAMILGGAAGNIQDRIVYGYVIDYADFHIGGFRPFLVFNVADAAITLGVLIILARSLFIRDKQETEKSSKTAADAAAESE